MFLNYAGKDYSIIDKRQYKSEIYLLLVTLVSFTGLGLIICTVVNSRIVLLTVLTIIPQCLIASFQALNQAWERFTEYSIINVLPKLLLTISIVVLFFWGHASGNTISVSYSLIVWGISWFFLIRFWKDTRGEKASKVFSKTNVNTTWNGLLITAGNYINILFHSIDKQFVLTLYSKESFALYTFAMSLQNIMMIFVNSLANPFYPRLAKEDIKREQLERIKELLLAFGIYAGCAFFVVSFIVSKFIQKYSGSLMICAVFFAVFPASAIINVLYINLYKIRKKLKKYIFTLIGMLVIAALANLIVVLINGGYTGIALATMLCYYIWLLYSQIDFDDIRISRKDLFFLAGFMIMYFMAVNLFQNPIVGFLVYIVVASIWNVFFYKDSIMYLINHFAKLNQNNGVKP